MRTPDRTIAMLQRSACREVAIVMEASKSFSRGVLAGVSGWMGQHDGWSVAIDDRERDAPIPGWLLRWAGDGLISGVDEAALPRPWRRGSRPVVHVRPRLTSDRLPGVYPDDDAALRLAVTHLVDRGIRRIAFCPTPSDTTTERHDSVARHAESLGCELDVFAPTRHRSGGINEREVIVRWLESLAKPVGVIATSDVRAVQILEACRARRLSVPDDVAVVGIGDDDVLGSLATPALTSVTHDRMRIGQEAAEMLDERMRSVRPASAVVLVPPMGIAVRRSSDTLAVADGDIRQALRLIRSKACTDLSAAEVATSVGIPRRLLDRKFQSVLGRTIHDELQRTRLAEAKRLLAETDHKLLIVSARSGFAHAAQLCNVFKSAVGMSPMQYRRTVRPRRELAGRRPR
jgi:LacI family transcriptional regulator